MKTIIYGSKNKKTYSLIKKAIAASGFEVSSVINGGTKNDIDLFSASYAKENNLGIVSFPIKWNEIHTQGAKIKEGTFGKYNAAAPFWRDEEMVKFSEAIIIINDDDLNCKNILKLASEFNLKVFVYPERSEKSEKSEKIMF